MAGRNNWNSLVNRMAPERRARIEQGVRQELNNLMAETIIDFFGGDPQFSAEPWYNPSGDSIHYHLTPEEFFGDRVDDKLTLYRSRETNEVVGCQIKGISAILKKFGR